jgi:Protein of unknown function (DUF3443)
MRNSLILACIPLLLLTACGGGGGGSNIGPTPPPPGQIIATPGPPNVEPVVLDAGPTNGPNFNTAYVTVTVCIPGGACQDIDHVEVDTGSTGLRLLAASAGGELTLNLPPATVTGGMTLAECLQFADGSSFGPLAIADIQMPTSGKTATSVTVQVIGAPGYTIASGQPACPPPLENNVSAFGANGILGVGPFAQDCGAACADPVNFPKPWYYTCNTTVNPATCAAASATVAQQLQNPVSLFTTDNNGVIVELPVPAAGGATSLSGGALVFGIGTQPTNNALGSATVLFIDPTSGFVQANFNGTAGLSAAIDSGSNGNFINDNIPQCTGAVGWYCPNSTLNLTSTLMSAGGGSSAAANFSVVNFESVFNANQAAAVMPNVAGALTLPPGTPNPIQFDLGMPFYFGRNIFTAIENAATPGGTGPYFAY